MCGNPATQEEQQPANAAAGVTPSQNRKAILPAPFHGAIERRLTSIVIIDKSKSHVLSNLN